MKDKLILRPQYKVLKTIQDLNVLSFYPNKYGVRKILIGLVDDETKDFINLKSFSSLISISARRTSSLITTLIRNLLLEYRYDKESDDLYLAVTSKGASEIALYETKHADAFTKKKSLNYKKTIIKL